MASVISVSNYETIATQYANARTSVLASVDYLFDAVYTIVQLDEIEPEVDLLTEFWNSYQINSDLFRNPVSFLSAVRRINNHVINRSSYTTLDAWLAGEAGTVPQAWATLSAAAGYTIDASRIV